MQTDKKRLAELKDANESLKKHLASYVKSFTG